ncbi:MULTISPECIES: hypothetical protein [unclassified Paenibacillus]|nr:MULTISPECIES: hypothetical protein [unclassified Paenibacillus]MDF9842587.1 hypothetical protein [Paenibacillus sp. PastF-2]MDF9849206.1 hypothetical protein [Paenibacillus sp. PastM-2]MDF9855747.1 hypothetical protein [Paenibacillus sp. PastF-1]MDH6481049.1 hypothetical protein [Paenibacillus sp. PastH-2]MDH6508439.1 hypothetical protein [Paenibacillus sp. PastM-3]
MNGKPSGLQLIPQRRDIPGGGGQEGAEDMTQEQQVMKWIDEHQDDILGF